MGAAAAGADGGPGPGGGPGQEPGADPGAGGAGAGAGGAALLPFPPHTLHYRGCGCPAAWQPGARAADLVDLLVHNAAGLWAAGRLAARRPLRVAYMLPHHKCGSGMLSCDAVLCCAVLCLTGLDALRCAVLCGTALC